MKTPAAQTPPTKTPAPPPAGQGCETTPLQPRPEPGGDILWGYNPRITEVPIKLAAWTKTAQTRAENEGWECERVPFRKKPEALLSRIDPLFCGCYPTGLVWSDRTRERHGDYVRLGYLNYRTLVLELEPDCPPDLAERIRTDAAAIQAKRGQPFTIAGNCTITLGE